MDATGELDLDVSGNQIMTALEAFVTRHFEPDDPAWAALVRENARLQRRRRIRRRILGWLPSWRRTQKSVEMNYSRQWLERSLERQVAVDGEVVPCVWRNIGMQARAPATKRIHLLFLMRLIARLKPSTVLEVGSGNGLNLFVLAGRFPETRFTGIEVTAGGVTATSAVRALPVLPEVLQAFAPEPLIDVMPSERIAVVRANASALPFSAASFDLVFTVLALEQMEEIRWQALEEIRRVARAHTAMVEPFRDWNATGPQRDYIVAMDYFRGSIADLESIGLRPVYAAADMPCKLTYRPGLVVCRVV